MAEPFQISIEGWLSPEYGDAADRATTAKLKIAVAGTVATRLEDLFSKSVRDTARVSAYRLAYWLADNWWRLRWEPSERSSDWAMSHRIGAAGGGYLWPDLTIVSDGDFVNLCAATPAYSTKGPVRYLSCFSPDVSALDYERGVDRFLGQVIQRLGDLRVADLDLSGLWTDVGNERNDPELTQWRRLEAMLGCDADQGNPALLQGLNRFGERFGHAAIDEIAAASKQSGALRELQAIEERRGQASSELTLPHLQDLRHSPVDAQGRDRLPWQVGEALADAARRRWALGSGPIASHRLADIAGAPVALLDPQAPPAAARIETAAAFRNPDHPERFSVLMRSRPAVSRRFEFARFIADQIWAANPEPLLPVTRAKTARQKMQRAFAGQFLCPYSELVEIVDPLNPDDDAIEEAAQHFSVSSQVVGTLLHNKGYRGRDLLQV